MKTKRASDRVRTVLACQGDGVPALDGTAAGLKGGGLMVGGQCQAAHSAQNSQAAHGRPGEGMKSRRARPST